MNSEADLQLFNELRSFAVPTPSMPKETRESNGVAFYNPEDEHIESDVEIPLPCDPPSVSRPLSLAMTLTKNDTVEQLKKCTLRQVDSEIFDTDSFTRYAPSPSGGVHAVSQPFEMAGVPIESLESRNQLVKELSTRSKSPQLIEMHTFRDAIDVNYQRMAITGEELSGVPLEDHQAAAKALIQALGLREEYMRRIGNTFPTTVSNFLRGEYPHNLPKCRKKNTESIWKRTETDPYLEERALRTRGGPPSERGLCILGNGSCKIFSLALPKLNAQKISRYRSVPNRLMPNR